MFIFRPKYGLVALLLLVTEAYIARFIHIYFIRAYAGDFLVVILLYMFVRTFIKASVTAVAIGVLLFAFFIEGLQYFHFLWWLKWQHSRVARIIIGDTFSFADLLAYTLGIGFVLLMEKVVFAYRNK